MVSSPGGFMHATGLTCWGPGTATSQVTCNPSRGEKITWNIVKLSTPYETAKKGGNQKGDYDQTSDTQIHHDWQGSFLGDSWVLAYVFIATGRNCILHTSYMDPISRSRWWLTVFHAELCIICMRTPYGVVGWLRVVSLVCILLRVRAMIHPRRSNGDPDPDPDPDTVRVVLAW